MQTIEIKTGQNLNDIAVRHAGSIEALFDIAVNNNISVTADLRAGESLTIPSVYDKRVVNYFVRNEIEPASKLTT